MLRRMAVKTHALVFAALPIAAAPSAAQTLPSAAAPLYEQAAPSTGGRTVIFWTGTWQPPVPPPAPPPQVEVAAPIDPRLRREQIVMMEGLLAAAVRSGAEETARLIKENQPELMLFTGTTRARGFYLEGYGVFFHVEIPGVVPSVASILASMERDRMSQGGRPSLASGTAVRSADESYTQAVQQKLINAMTDYRISLRPDEWLTIAARDGEAPPMPGQLFESITLILRIKGADLADFFAGRITQDEVRKRVEVREF